MSGEQLTVGSLARYLSSIERKWREEDYRAHKLVQLTKGEKINGFVYLGPVGNRQRFDNDNGELGVQLALRTMAKALMARVTGPGTIVPIPNSNGTPDAKTFRTLQLATMLARCTQSRYTVSSCLRWRAQKDTAHKSSGFRSADALMHKLVLTEIPRGPVILFDDVITSGSQMRAAYRLLARAERTPVFGVTVGRTTREQHEEMLRWHEEQIDIEPPEEQLFF